MPIKFVISRGALVLFPAQDLLYVATRKVVLQKYKTITDTIKQNTTLDTNWLEQSREAARSSRG
jgi:TfoX/Sxy family transcriptional regulator of competence genes